LLPPPPLEGYECTDDADDVTYTVSTVGVGSNNGGDKEGGTPE
jgi:hypothetical protein